MSNVNVSLSYDHLSSILLNEINNRNLEVKSHPIKLSGLRISGGKHKLKVNAKVDSTWDAEVEANIEAYFDKENQAILVRDLDIDFKANNILFRGILAVAKNTVIKRTKKELERPLSELLDKAKATIDQELIKVNMPHNLNIKSQTKELVLKELNFEENGVQVAVEVELNLWLISPNITETQIDV